MKIEGLGQINPIDAINVNKVQNETSDFQNILQKAFDEGDKEKLKKVCDQYEAEMLKMLYKQMKATIPEGGLIEKSSARGIFEDMLDEALMETGSRRGIGISDMMYKQLSAQMDRTYKVQSNKQETDITTPESDGAGSIEE